jgi:hypothetical protein
MLSLCEELGHSPTSTMLMDIFKLTSVEVFGVHILSTHLVKHLYHYLKVGMLCVT